MSTYSGTSFFRQALAQQKAKNHAKNAIFYSNKKKQFIFLTLVLDSVVAKLGRLNLVEIGFFLLFVPFNKFLSVISCLRCLLQDKIKGEKSADPI